jgi:sodium/bile acid cotransporter 7
LGFLLWQPLHWFGTQEAAWLRNAIVAGVLFLMAWPLESSAVWAAFRRPWAAMLAFALNLGLLPLVAWSFSPLLRSDLAVGLLVAAAAPCTLASAAVWTRRAGGNDAVALMVTITTNLLCFLITPLWLLATTGRGDIELPVGKMIANLGLLVVLPMVIAQLTRLNRSVAEWTTRRKTPLSTLAQCGILAIVLIGAIRSASELAKAGTVRPQLVDFAGMIVAVVLVHSIVLAMGHLFAWAIGLRRPERIAVGFAGSQKTLMVGIYIATYYYPGLALLPMVAYHVCQLIIDTLVVDRLRTSASSNSFWLR